jgi:hypothetical protein
MSEVVMSFLEPENDQSRLSKYVVQAGWKDVPHLDEEEKRPAAKNFPVLRVRLPPQGSGIGKQRDEGRTTALALSFNHLRAEQQPQLYVAG